MHIAFIGDILIYNIVAHVEHMYTISADFFARFFANFYSAVIPVIIPFATVIECVAVVNDPVAPDGRSPSVAT